MLRVYNQGGVSVSSDNILRRLNYMHNAERYSNAWLKAIL